jgi:nucleolar protein 6
MGFSAGTSRAERKAKKRKLENSIPDVPEDLETESTHEEITSAKRKRYSHDGVHGSAKQDGEKSEHLEKSDRKVKRTKVDTTDAPSSSLQTGDQEASSLNDENAPKKSKKERKAERKAREAAAATATPETPATTTTSEQGAADKASRMESAKTNAGTSVRKKQKVPNSNPNTEGKAARFIVFIGKAEFQEACICASY